jgi:cytochrome c oxidase cbb3-type subunit 3
MRSTNQPDSARVAGLIFAALAGLAAAGAAQAPQQLPAQAPPPPRFPAQLRPPDDPQVIARGKRVYDVSCRACHGADLRGGDMGGPNLLRSEVMLNDNKGERLLPILQGGRASMPAIDLPPGDVGAVAAYVHSVLAQGRAQGAPPAAPPAPLSILVGDAEQGRTYFEAKCSACHSVTGDLQGIGGRVAEPVELQNLWVGGGKREPIDPTRPPTPRDVMVVVTPPTGSPIEGRLDRIDDFAVTLILPDGIRRTIRRVGDVPKVEIRDPLAIHKQLLQIYTDRDIHNVTAYLVTVK